MRVKHSHRFTCIDDYDQWSSTMIGGFENVGDIFWHLYLPQYVSETVQLFHLLGLKTVLEYIQGTRLMSILKKSKQEFHR